METQAKGDALSCRRYEEVDWSAFLREPQDGEFDEFRAHYPSCAECSAEVRVWTELLEGVGANAADPAHPTPEELECFDRAPGELDATRSDFISDHLRRCSPCAEELHLLRGHNAAVFVEIADEAKAPAPRRLWQPRWSPAIGLVLVGLLLFPLLYRSVGPGTTSPPTRPEASAPEAASEPKAGVLAQNRAVPAKQGPGDAPAVNVPSAVVLAPSAPSADALEAQRPAGLAASDAAERRARAPSKSEDPLAHHVWIPTMRLRPGQKSSGPASELRNGFFLEVPLPRDAPAGEARVLILPDGPGAPGAGDVPPAPLAAGQRALEMLSKRDTENESTLDDAAPKTRGFEERVAVQPMQRALLLQVPAEILEPGVYRVDLELHSEGAIRGRARFRLELVAE